MPSTTLHDVTHADPAVLAGIEPLPAPQLLRGARHEDAFGGDDGLRMGPAFSPAEVVRIKALVKEQLLYAAAATSQEAADALDRVELEHYHTVSAQFDHARMLSKMGRILSAEAVGEIKAMSFFAYVREAFGDYYLADEDGVGHEQITLRVVRPGRREDVGSLHRDSWFWDHYGWPVRAGENRAKVWTGICVDAPLNGLMLAPGSHLRDCGHRVDHADGKVAFTPAFDWREIGLRRFDGRPGDPILFNYKTLHVGSLNRAQTCRVSIETTIMYR